MLSHDDLGASQENFGALMIELLSELNNISSSHIQCLALLSLVQDIISFRRENSINKATKFSSSRGLQAIKVASSILDCHIEKELSGTCQLVAIELRSWLRSLYDHQSAPPFRVASLSQLEMSPCEDSRNEMNTTVAYPRIEKVLESKRKKKLYQRAVPTEGKHSFQVNNPNRQNKNERAERNTLKSTNLQSMHQTINQADMCSNERRHTHSLAMIEDKPTSFQTRLLFAATSCKAVMLSLGLEEASRVLRLIEESLRSTVDEEALLRAAGFLSHCDFRVRQRATSALALVGMCLDRQALEHGDSLDMTVNLKLMFDEPVVNPKEPIRVDALLAMKHFLLGRQSYAFWNLRVQALSFLLQLICNEIENDLHLGWKGFSFSLSKGPTQRVFLHRNTSEPLWFEPDDERMFQQENDKFLIKFQFLFRRCVGELELDKLCSKYDQTKQKGSPFPCWLLLASGGYWLPPSNLLVKTALEVFMHISADSNEGKSECFLHPDLFQFQI
mmetsp:Transcript_1228/g.3800  ORF Transcript_1228/g.3800 Transcript_1228/m.3800 type:complete len:502 (+) Transcript_1228:188-1693(+)